VTDTKEATTPDAPPRRSTRWLGATSAVFALGIVFGGADLVTRVSASSWRFLIILALTVAFLLFALLGAGILPRTSNQPAIAGIGVVILSLALAVSWSAPDTLSGPAIIKTGNESICGDITSMGHDFVAITEHVGTEYGPGGGQLRSTYVQRLVPVASIESITGVDDC
jgi:hypothetical protein